MSVISLDVDKSKLHKGTNRIIAKDGNFVEVNQKGEALVTHHLQSMVLHSTTDIVFSMVQGVPAPAVPVRQKVSYYQDRIKEIYKQLELAAGKGTGDVDAAGVLNKLKQAEV